VRYRGAVLFNLALSLCEPRGVLRASGPSEFSKVAYVIHSISHRILYHPRCRVNRGAIRSYKPLEAPMAPAAFLPSGPLWRSY
jgi:hypothetical protein